MGVEFSNTLNQRVDFSTLSSIQLLQQKTFLFWVNLSTTTGEVVALFPSGASDEEWGVSIPAAGGGDDRLFFYADWSTTQGQWYSTNVLSTGLQFLAITYNYGSTSNDPVMYVNGSSVAVTESTAPSGSYRTGTNNSLRVGNVFPINGTLISFLIYNRIMSATEILEAYNSRKAIPTYNGLVFAPQLNGAAGLQTFGGATLAAGNTIVDSISGAIGTPSGSPVGVGDTILTYGG